MPLPPDGVEVRFRPLPAQSELDDALADMVGVEFTVTAAVVPDPLQPLLSVTVTLYAPLVVAGDTLVFCVVAVNEAGPFHA